MLRIVKVAALSCLLVLLSASGAVADDQVVVDTTLHQVQVLSLLIGTVLPIAVGLITKTVTSESTKAILLAALSAVSGFGTEYVNHFNNPEAFDLASALLTWVSTFVVAVAMHYGLWKPTGVAAKAQTIAVK